MPDDKANIFGLTINELENLSEFHRLARFRGRQIAQWIYRHRVTDFAAMTNLSSTIRADLAEKFVIDRPRPTETQISVDGTRKMLFQLDGGAIECVLMFDNDRRTLCVSSQIGCPLSCRFCATGTMDYTRNLLVSEIVAQVLAANDSMASDEAVSNLVFMGMGEPLLNLENLETAIGILSSELGPAISQKKMTISTVGLPPRIQRLAESGLKVGLAISLCTADEQLRRELMPVDKKYTLASLKEAALAYFEATGRRVTLEIILMKDINDSITQAKKLVSFIHGIPCKINLIRYHPHPGAPFEKPDEEKVLAFRDYLYPRAPAVTIRKSFGEDIAAACGQLATQEHLATAAR